MEAVENVSYIMAFGAGMWMFLSPCILPLIPAYIAYLTGVSLKDQTGELSPQKQKKIRLVTVFHSLLFIMGFTLVFVALGATATYIGRLLLEYQEIIKRIGGLCIMFFGLYVLGVVKLNFLEKEKRLKYRKEGVSYIGSFLVGATFAAAWTPCLGPILASILVYAANTADLARGIKLLSVFSLGLGVPFFLSSLFISSFIAHFKKIQRYIRWVTVIGGVFLVIVGALLLSGNFYRLELFFMR